MELTLALVLERQWELVEAVKNWRASIPFKSPNPVLVEMLLCQNASPVGPELLILRESGNSDGKVLIFRCWQQNQIWLCQPKKTC